MKTKTSANTVISKKHKNSRTINIKPIKVLHYLLLFLAALLFMGPFIWLLIISLLPESASLFSTSLDMFKHGISLGAYKDVWTIGSFDKYIYNTLIVASVSAISQIIFCSMAGYALARMKFKGVNIIFVLILSTMMVPLEATLIPSYSIISNFNLLDTYAALILPAAVTPFAVFLFRQAFAKVPIELEEAARMEGSSEIRLFFIIMLPLVAPSIATVGIFTFVTAWSSLLWPLVVINSKEMFTISLGLANLDSAFVGGWRQISAGAIISLLPVLVVFLFGQKYFIRGIASGSVK